MPLVSFFCFVMNPYGHTDTARKKSRFIYFDLFYLHQRRDHCFLLLALSYALGILSVLIYLREALDNLRSLHVIVSAGYRLLLTNLDVKSLSFIRSINVLGKV